LFQFNPLIGDSFSKEIFKLVLAVETLSVVLQRVCRPKNPAAFPSQSGIRISNHATTMQIEMVLDWHSSYLGQCEVEAEIDSQRYSPMESWKVAFSWWIIRRVELGDVIIRVLSNFG
jgi:hypothetical protein